MSNVVDRLGGARSSLAFKAPVRCATTGNITLAGFQTIDGVTLTASDTNLRVLVRAQTTAAENGIWVAQSGNWARARDFDGNSDILKGTRVYVANGTTYADTGWAVTTADPIVVGTSNLTFAIPGDLAREGYIDFDEQASVSNPAANVARLYAYDSSGATRIAYKDSAGNVNTLGLDIAGLAALQTVDFAADQLVVYDASAGTNKSMLLDPLARYGIDRTGASNSAAAVQTMVNECDVVYALTDAVVRVDSAISITSATRFWGIGRTAPGGTTAKLTFVSGTTTNDIFHVKSDSVSFDQIDIRGIAGRATLANVTAKQARGIVVGPDSRTVTGGISASGTTVTLSSGSFTSADVGARIHIPGAYTGTSTPEIVSQTGSQCVVSIAANNTVAGATITIAHAYEDFLFTNGSVHSQSIGIDLRNAAHHKVEGSRLHGFYAVRAACEIGSDIGDATIVNNELQTPGTTDTRALYHTSGGSLRIVNNKFQNAEIHMEVDWTVGQSGGPHVIANLFENSSSKHILVKDAGAGAVVLENVIIASNIFNGAPTTLIEFSDSGGTGWCKGVEITGNRFTSSSAGTFVSIGKAVAGAHIGSNTFYDSSGSGATGIDVKGSAANVFVGVNKFEGIASLLANASASSRFDIHALTQLSTAGLGVRTGTNAWTTRSIGGTTNEVNVTNGDGVSGNPTLALAATLELAAKTVNVGDSTFSIKDTADATRIAKFETGSITTGTTRTFTFPDVSGTVHARSIAGTANEITVTNGDGASAAPTISLASTLTLTAKAVSVTDANFSILDNADATKIAQFQASSISTGTTRTFTFPDVSGSVHARAIAGTANEINVTNGDGVSGSPTILLASTLALSGKTVNVGDSTFSILDTADATKIAKFENGSITTGTTRTFTFPDLNGTLLALVSGNANPLTSDGGALGTTSLMWSDLFLASGGVINFNNGDVTITHSANTLAFAGASSGYTLDALMTVTSANASALAVGANGSTNPVLKINAATASVATGIEITGAAAASRVALAVVSSGANEGLSIDAKGSGTIRLGATSTGAVEFSRNAVPTASDGAALGTTALMWSDGFFASGGVLNFNNGASTVTHSGNKLTVAGGNNEVFEMNGGTASTVGRVLSTGASAYLAFQNTGGSAAATIMGVANGGDFELQAADSKGLLVKKAGGAYAYMKSGPVTASADTAIPAGGTAGEGVMMSTTTNFGIFFGSGAPTLAAAQGSFYFRSDGSTSTNRAYINTDGSTGWTAITTAS